MGYDIKYEEIRNVRSAILNAVSQWQSELNLLQGYFSNLQNSIGMQGNTANSIINYTRDVHVPAITNLVEMLTEYQSKIAVYEEGFIGIDGSSESHIKQSVLEETIQQLQSKRNEYEPLHESITGVIDSVSDIFQSSKPSSIYIQDKFAVLDEKLKKLNEDVGTYENSHLTDCDSVRDYIQTIKSFINGKSGGNQVAVDTYTTRSILDNPIYQELEVCKQGSQAYVENHQDEIEVVSQRNQMEIKEELDRMEKEQKLQGIISIVGGAIAIIGAVGAVVLTGGLAIPLVAAAMSVGAATVTIYAASDMVEGVSRYQLAEAGRFGSIPFHPVRDIVFQGDQQLSDRFRVVGDALFLAGGVGSMLERAAVSPIQKGVTNLGGHANSGSYKLKNPPKIKNAQFSKGASGAKVPKDIKYSPINPGPLKEDVAKSFNGASYTEKVLMEDTVMYRVHGGEAGEIGSYLSKTPQGGGLQSQLDLALNPSWGNTTENVTKVVVPKGTVIYEGTAAPQNILDSLGNKIGTLPGGGNQIYIPEVNAGWFK